MIKCIIIFAIGFIYGITFAVYAMAKADEKKPQVKKSEKVSIPYSMLLCRSKEIALSAVDKIQEEYENHGYILSVSEYNKLFNFKQENPLHSMCGWFGPAKLNIKIEEINGQYKIVMPPMGPLR